MGAIHNPHDGDGTGDTRSGDDHADFQPCGGGNGDDRRGRERRIGRAAVEITQQIVGKVINIHLEVAEIHADAEAVAGSIDDAPDGGFQPVHVEDGDPHAGDEAGGISNGDDGPAVRRVGGRGDGEVERAGLRLRIDVHIPDFATAAELEQRAVPLVGAGIDVEALGGRVDGGLGLARVILIDELRQDSVGEADAGGGRAARAVHRVVGVIG